MIERSHAQLRTQRSFLNRACPRLDLRIPCHHRLDDLVYAMPFGANYLRAIDGAEAATLGPERGIIFFKSSSCSGLLFEQDQHRRLRLRWRLRSVVTGAIAPLGHKLVELGPVLGEA